MKETLTRNFIDICQGISELGLEIGPSGNLSIIGEDNNFLITPTGADFGKISERNISYCSINSDLYSGPKPSSDVDSHKRIFVNKKNTKVILHTHSHYITLASMISSDVPVLNTMHADYFGRPIKCVQFSNHRMNGFGNIEGFDDDETFILSKHGGLILFPEIDVEKIINSVRAFDEVCRLFFEYKMLNVDTYSIPKEDYGLLHTYYKNIYGNKSK